MLNFWIALPNETWYLSASLRRQLQKMGKTTDIDAPAGTYSRDERIAVQALIVEELRRLHEGVLARYGLRPSEFKAWKTLQR